MSAMSCAAAPPTAVSLHVESRPISRLLIHVVIPASSEHRAGRPRARAPGGVISVEEHWSRRAMTSADIEVPWATVASNHVPPLCKSGALTK